MVIFSARKPGLGQNCASFFQVFARSPVSSFSSRLAAASDFSPGSSRPAGNSHRNFRAGSRYWRTSSTRFFSSTGITTADPAC